MECRIKPATRLDDYRPIFFELGLIIVLLTFILVVRTNFGIDTRNQMEHKMVDQLFEEYHISELKLISEPGNNGEISLPAPPKPRVGSEAPEDEIVEDLEFDDDLSFGGHFDLPPTPLSNEEPEEGVVYIAIKHLPELIGGLASLRDEISYPELARRMGIEGRVFVQFIVSEIGEVEDPRIIRGIGGGCDEEVYHAIKKMRFRPGMLRGRPVRVQYTVSVLFRLYY